jgi:uncharacterized protein YjdB
MRTKITLILGLFIGLFTSEKISAQINSVNYLMKYDTTNCWYDCYVVINNGSASGAQTIAFFSQLSIVSLAGDSLIIEDTYQPVGDVSGVPVSYAFASKIKHPAAQPANDFWSITRPTNETAHYPNLSPGDTVKLFSVSKFNATTLCGADLRLFINGTDPSSSDPGMEGSDFSNEFTIGVASNQVYSGNSEQILGPNPIIHSIDLTCSSGIEIDLTSTTTACQNPLSYDWSGPSSYTNTTQDVIISPATPSNNGMYYVTITDNIGCEAIDSIEAVSKPNAGPDITICAGSVDTITGSPLTGAWTKITNNASVTTTNLSPGVNRVAFASTMPTTVIKFKYTVGSGSCSDTMQFNVNALPSITMTDANACVGDVIVNNLTANIGPGIWTSSNPSVATVTATSGTQATVTALAQGTTTFTYTRTSTQCSNTTAPFTVNALPTISSVDPICIGGVDNVNPNTGGSYTSAIPGVATITDAGLVTGISEGSSTITFVDGNGCIDTDTVFVIAKPTVSIAGNDSICVNSTTTLSPGSAGTWASNHPLVANVNNQGQVTGLMPGIATFTFTALGGCSSDPTDTVYVVADPVAAISDNQICDNTTATLSPASGGTWSGDNNSVATVSGNIVTAQSNGTVTFTFTNPLGCNDAVSLIVDPIPSVSSDMDTICISAQAQLSPSSGGTWQNLTPGIVSYNAATKRITGISEGTAMLIFTESATLCKSDTLYVEVEPRPSITADESDMCIGDTRNFEPSSGGIWEVSPVGIATIENDGKVTAITAGTVQFRFTSTSSDCASDWTGPITINPNPEVTVPDALLCITETVQLVASGSSGGTWSHENIANNTKASIDINTGLVTALAAGSNIRFIYTDGNGCASAPSASIQINAKPEVNFVGPNPICIDATTNVTSNSAVGTWTVVNGAIASIVNGEPATVTGLASGTTNLIFTQTSGSCKDTIALTVAPKPVVNFAGDTLCQGGSITITVTPAGPGSWSTNNSDVATITSGGVVNAVGPGNTTFRFTSTNGNCPSDNSNPLVVNAPETLSMPESELCIGETMVLSPSSGGTWTSNNTTVATVSGATVTAVAEGLVTFSYVDVNGCSATTDGQLEVNPRPDVNINVDNRCVGLTSNAFPNSGGSWTSADTTIATINNSGLITAKSPGTTTFTFVHSASGCASNPTEPFTVDPGPVINYAGDSVLCIGETTSLEPNTGGSWAIAPSFSTTVANITPSGSVTALAAGFTRFVFTDASTGCKSEPSGPLTVNPKPTIFIDGLSTICIGATSQLFPSSNGTWVSSDTTVATVSNATGSIGLVTGVAEGGATFTFTNSSTGCVSDASDSLFVSAAPDVSITGEDEICVGGRTTLSPTTGGTWTSNNPDIASVNPTTGVVTAIAPGVATFRFADNIGCGSATNTDPVTISNCSNPDFNATFVNVAVPGDVNTNDQVASTTTYGPSYNLISKPSGSNPSLSLNSDGTYDFISDMVGLYKYTVPLCVPPVSVGCPVEDLWITVVDHTEPDKRPVANVDFATTIINTPVVLMTLDNDRCVVVTGCNLDPASVVIIDNPGRGTALVDLGTGDITYTPATGATGRDTLVYRVCVDGEPTNCAEARQIITIIDPSAVNTTVADDDFAVTMEQEPISGNVSLNDSDPQGDDFEVIPVSYSDPAIGSISIAADGSYTFTPAEYFTGPVEYVYTSFDDHPTAPDSQQATLHILVVPDLAIKIRVYLEGSLINNNGATAADGRPLMRDNLRNSPFQPGTRHIPNKDPYKFNPNDYNTLLADLTTKFDHVTVGNSANITRFDSVRADRLSIFNVTGQDALVDWVFVELRDKSSNTLVLNTRSGLVQRDGDVVDLDGVSPLKFPGLKMDNYYVVVRHRNHLGAMTKNPMTPKQLVNLVNFTKDSLPVFEYDSLTVFTKIYKDGAPTQVVNGPNTTKRHFIGLAMNTEVPTAFGYRALWGGDFNSSGKLKFDNPNDDLNQLFGDVFFYPSNTSFNSNYDFAYGYNPGDFDMNGKSKYDNPNDDKNLLYEKILFYPLNTDFLSNFDFFIEQIP